MARQIASEATKRSQLNGVAGVDPLTIISLLLFIAKTCTERRMVRKMRVYPRMAMARAYRLVDTHEATKDLDLPVRIAIAEAMIDCGTRANETTVSLIEQEIGWAEVAGE
jgi:hypothetical protein